MSPQRRTGPRAQAAAPPLVLSPSPTGRRGDSAVPAEWTLLGEWLAEVSASAIRAGRRRDETRSDNVRDDFPGEQGDAH
jgi:hypothetical protein